MKSVSVIIPNFNGKDLLAENLPVLLASLPADSSGCRCEVIVVDDGSTDGSADFVARTFPGIKLVRLDSNHGFSPACNAGVKESSGEIVYFLNSDIKVSGGFLDALLPHFDDESTFSVSSAEVARLAHSDNDEEMGLSFARFRFGIFWYWYENISKKNYLASGERGIEVFCVSGGHTAVDKKKYCALVGFDALFSPFYAEDGDICWRAWKRGWKSLIEPRSVVEHQCKGTIGRFYSRAEILRIHWKNRLLMMWKNLTSPWLWCKHLFFIIPEVVICPFIGKGELTGGFFLALGQIPDLLRSRRRDRVEREACSDRALFSRFSDTGRFPPQGILYLHETGQLSGAENSLLQLLTNLDTTRFRPVVACPRDGLFAEQLQAAGIMLCPVTFPRVRNITGVYAAVRKIRRLIKENNIRLIHSNSIRTHIYGVFAACPAKIPVVWHERNLPEREIIDPDRLLSFLPAAIICNSEAIARRFMRNARFPEKVLTIHNGVDLKRFSPLVKGDEIRSEFGIAPQEIVIGIASRFSKNKGHDTFLRAAAKALGDTADRRQRLRFMIAGGAVFSADIDRERELREMARSLKIEERLIFTGFRKEMPEIYAAMDIFVLASDAEPCGRVIIEAMASGKPVIGTRSGGTAEMVIDGVTGILVDPGNAEEIARAFGALIGDESMRRSMGSAGRKRVEDIFDIRDNVRKTEALYTELLRRNR